MVLFEHVTEAFIASRELDKASLSRLAFWVDAIGQTGIAAITSDDIDEALVKLAKRGRLSSGTCKSSPTGKPLAGATVNRYLAQAGSIFKYARRMARVRRSGRMIEVVDIDVTNEKRSFVAIGRGTCYPQHDSPGAVNRGDKMRRIICGVALGVAHAAFMISPAAFAQTYPMKPVRVLVGYAPGGIADTSARIVSQQLTSRLKANFIIDSRPGAGGRIAAEAATKVPPDGYTLLFGTEGTHSVAVVTVKGLPYDPIKDFTPIGLIGKHGFSLVVHPSLPVKSLKELIALARKYPGKLNYSSSGTGSGIHFATELFRLAAKVDLTHIPYKGAAPALQDVVAGRIELTLSPSAAPQVEAGQVRLLGTTSARRDPRFPDAPTLAEAGLPGFEAIGWTAIFGPANTPPAIVSQLNAAMNAALSEPDTIQRLRIWGSIASPGEPAELEALLKSEIVRYRTVAADAKLTFE